MASYPGAFRDEYGRELSLPFVDRYRDATGAPFVMAGGRLVSALVFGISPHDFFGAAIVLAAVASASSLLPARRASRVDPLVALRQE